METPDEDKLDYVVRPASHNDWRFIIETTAKVRQPRSLTWEEWEPYARCWVESILNNPKAPGACWTVEASGVVLGFVLLSTNSLSVEMLYVKQKFRGLGFGRLLLDAAGFDDDVPCRAPTESWRLWARRRGVKYKVTP